MATYEHLSEVMNACYDPLDPTGEQRERLRAGLDCCKCSYAPTLEGRIRGHYMIKAD